MMNINMMIIGPVSAGKTTFVNSLFAEQLSDMKIKRTTAVPQIYHEVEDDKDITDITTILLKNREINASIMKKTESDAYKLKLDDIKENEYNVSKLYKFVKMRQNVLLTIYDTPGLNDSRTKDVYHEYINSVFHKLNIIVLILDIYSAMNTSDENDILRMILRNIKTNKHQYNIETKLIVLLNKCDDMSLNENTQKYSLDTELQEMYDQANNIIAATVREIYSEFTYDILPISCEDAYVYRMYEKNPNAKLDEKHMNKFGANEYGKSKWNALSAQDRQTKVAKLFEDFDYNKRMAMTGFTEFINIMQNILNDNNQYKYLVDKIRIDIQKNINDYDKIDIETELNLFTEYYKYMNILVEKFDKTVAEYEYLYDVFDVYIINWCNKFNAQFWQLNKNSIDILNIIYKLYNVYKNKFIDNRLYIANVNEFTKLTDIYNKKINEVIKIINIYWIEKLDNSEISIRDMLTCYDKLFENKYNILHEIINRKLSNIDYYTKIYHSNFNTTDEFLELLNTIEKRYNFTSEEITALVIKIAQSIHGNPRFTDKLNDMLFPYDNIILKTSNKYYVYISVCKKLLAFNVLNKIHIDNKYGKIANYIIGRIKNEYPTEIAYYDDLIDIFHSKKTVEQPVKNNTNAINIVSELDKAFINAGIIKAN